MRGPPLLLCVSLLSLAVARGGNNAEEAGVLPGNPLARSCGDQPGQRSVYVSTIDGGLTALDVEEGRTLWTYRANTPLFFSSLNPPENDEVTERIIPGLDRGMYHWDGQTLTQLPFTADDLIDHTHLLKGRGSILAGAKANDVVGVNIHTGKPIYECSHEKCHRYDNQSLIHRMDVLKLSTSRVTVREASDLTGEELWNFTVGGMQLMLVEGEEPGEEGGGGHSCGVFQELQWKLHADTLRGVVYATDRANSDPDHHLWEVELGVPVVRAWLHEGGKLEPISLSSLPPASGQVAPSLMMVHYSKQYYLQPVQWEGQGVWLEMESRTAGRSGGIEKSAGDEGTVFNMFSRHYSLHADMLATNQASEEKSLMLYYDQDTFSEMCTQGPYGLAVYFYSDLLPTSDYKTAVEENNSESSETVCPLPSDSFRYQEPSWQQWVISKLLSVIKYMLFGAFVLVCNKLRHHIRTQRHRNSSTSSSTSSSADILDDDEFPQLPNMLRRHSSLAESASTLQRTPSLQTGSSTETIVSFSRANSVPEPRVLPRFGSDYELKGRLGKGGFGVVYHVQNKTDGGEYAVKRIKLPSNKAAREKVMREVRALAQLDHPRIVRYFNSWVEKAPTGWNEMEEWMPLSRRPSYIMEQGSNSTAPPPPPPSVGGHSSNISPCPSFNSLSHSTIHSILPPPRTTDSDSKSGSFVIEFREESDQLVSDAVLSDCHHRGGSSSQLLSGQSASDIKPANGIMLNSKNGCFSRDLLRDRDDLSSTDSSQSTQHKEERRDSIADLGAEPPTYLFIQMQLCQKESLKDWLRSNISCRSHGKVMHFFDQILDAVRYVHRKGMMHRDLKPSNIFFSLEGTVKVGDFGLVTSSVYGGLRNSYLVLKGLGSEEEQHKQHTGNLGTHFYMSPEQMSGHKYDHKVDIYSLGVIFFELHYPFQTDMERAKVLEDVRKHKLPASFEAKLPRQAELVKWLMAHHANDRPIVEDIYNSDTFKQLQENLMETIPKL